ncbi:nucleotide-diphospho-sugar transferase [Dichotomocladium elegans]|nr:nucleotide-diphospho-sugar transferase [Dichotomocladium elegans]
MTIQYTLKPRAGLRIILLSTVLSFFIFIVLKSADSLADRTAQVTSFWPKYRHREPLDTNGHLQPNPHFHASFVTLTKGDHGSLSNLRATIRNLEDTFNRNRRYPYIIFSPEPLSNEFRELVQSVASSDVGFYELNSTMYGYDSYTNLTKAAEARAQMAKDNVIFGDSEDYRFASRFMAGTIFSHPALQGLDYYWRFEIGTEYICPIDFDPFQYMYDNKKTYSFSMALYEYPDTIPSLFDTVQEFAAIHPKLVKKRSDKKSLWYFVMDEDSEDYNRCHFWSNFQIADLNFFRSKEYQAYFDHLERSGGFFYERWGDPVVQTLGAVLFLEKKDVHFWENIGYRVANYFTHCPADRELYKKCSCRPEQNFDNDANSCLMNF